MTRIGKSFAESIRGVRGSAPDFSEVVRLFLQFYTHFVLQGHETHRKNKKGKD